MELFQEFYVFRAIEIFAGLFVDIYLSRFSPDFGECNALSVVVLFFGADADISILFGHK